MITKLIGPGIAIAAAAALGSAGVVVVRHNLQPGEISSPVSVLGQLEDRWNELVPIVCIPAPQPDKPAPKPVAKPTSPVIRK